MTRRVTWDQSQASEDMFRSIGRIHLVSDVCFAMLKRLHPSAMLDLRYGGTAIQWATRVQPPQANTNKMYDVRGLDHCTIIILCHRVCRNQSHQISRYSLPLPFLQILQVRKW